MFFSPFRRSLLLAAITLPFSFAFAPLWSKSQDTSADLDAASIKKIEELETESKGRLGVFAINTADNSSIHYRADECFPFCSTFKVLLAAAILHKSMSQKGYLQGQVAYTNNELVSYSPITEKHVAKGMSRAELCAATVQYSDNTAANLLIKELGKPAALTEFARSIGDTSFRLDRWETELNTAIPGDERDTTTPAAMAASLQKLVLGNILDNHHRHILQNWLIGNTTGATRIRAGVPDDWIVGDKTGSGVYGTTNDVGVLWPKSGAPIVLAVYFTQTKKDAPVQERLIATVTRTILEHYNF